MRKPSQPLHGHTKWWMPKINKSFFNSLKHLCKLSWHLWKLQSAPPKIGAGKPPSKPSPIPHISYQERVGQRAENHRLTILAVQNYFFYFPKCFRTSYMASPYLNLQTLQKSRETFEEWFKFFGAHPTEKGGRAERVHRPMYCDLLGWMASKTRKIGLAILFSLLWILSLQTVLSRIRSWMGLGFKKNWHCKASRRWCTENEWVVAWKQRNFSQWK